MFRRLKSSLPKDPHFPADLKELGYFVNDTGHIRKIEYPDEDFQFWTSTCDRYNDLQREAMHTCIRREVSARLTALNAPLFYLPQLTSTQPDPSATASLPIHCTPSALLRQKRHVIVVMNRAYEDLGIHSYRILSKSGGIYTGSAVSLVRSLRRRAEERASRSSTSVEEEMPGVIVMNPGQLLYSYRRGCAMTPMSWDAMPRKSCVYPAPRIDDKWNRVDGNEGIKEHVIFVFEKVLGDETFVRKDAALYIIGLCDGGEEVVKYLESNWPLAHPRLAADWHSEKTRQQLVQERSELRLYPLLSGGEVEYDEVVVCRCGEAVLDWFEEVAGGDGGGAAEGYRNPELAVPEKVLLQDISQIPVPEEFRGPWVSEGENEKVGEGASGDGVGAAEELPVAEDVD